MAKETFRISNALISVLTLSCKNTSHVALDFLLADQHAPCNHLNTYIALLQC